MSRNVGVICVGKTTIDQILTLNQLRFKYHLDAKTGDLSFRHGEKIDVEESEFCIGGNATNVAVGLRRLGFEVVLFSEIGDDEFGLKIRSQLEREGIDSANIKRRKHVPSSFSVIINYRGERTIFIQRIRRENNFHFEGIETSHVFLTSLDQEWEETYEQVLDLVVRRKCKLAFNPGTLQLQEGLDVVEKILAHTDILFVNKEEAEQIVFGHEKRKRDNEVDYVRELLSKIKKMGAKCVVITNGKHGSYAVERQGDFYSEGIFPGKLVERTGSGDGYVSGFLAGIMHGRSMKEAMRWGAVNSASVIERVGATAGLLHIKEMRGRVG
jgi:sugar/nucleoside kinase (ribokinase family)